VRVVAPSRDFSSSSDNKAQVLAATDIVQLISQTVKLTRRGKNFVGLCPFHNEKSPSFNVNPAGQYYKCFGCNEGGNAIDFVIKRDRVQFIDALRTLAQAAGIELRGSGQSREGRDERQVMLDAHVAAVSFYQSKLQDPQVGAVAREYLEQRGFNAETIEKFRVGVAPDGWDWLLQHPAMRKFPAPLLAQAGLLKVREKGGGFYDTFRNRLMFPIRNDVGQTVAFGGRIMPGADPKIAKYLNSPESPLFSKGKVLYGLDMARQRIVETGTVAIVEGYTDVMMAHQFGVSNVVAVLGTGLTDQHMKLLRRFANKIVLLFDADAAGDKAADRVVQLFLTQDVELAVASMPEGMDPDEFLLAHGAEAFEKILAGATDVLSFKWKQLARQFKAHEDDLTGQQKAVEEYLGLLAAARGAGPVDSLRWGSALTRVSRLTEIPIDVLNRRFRAVKPTAHPVSPVTSEPRADEPARQPNLSQTNVPQARRVAERWILGLLLSEPSRWHDVQVDVGVNDFLDERHHRIAEVYWDHQRDEGEIVFSTFLGLVDDQALKELAIELVDEIEGLKERSSQSSGGVASSSSDGSDSPDSILDKTQAAAVGYLADAKRGREQQKLLAALRRNSNGNSNSTSSSSEENTAQQSDGSTSSASTSASSLSARQSDELAMFEALVKNNPSTNLFRLGPVKRGR
jgi:DNA primase